MPVTGAIADRARGVLPIAWDALSRDVRFGDGSIQAVIDLTKERVLGTGLATGAEGTLPLIVVDYLAKLVALELISPAIDYFMNEPLSESATGTNENHTFTERANELRLLRAALLDETRRLKPDVDPLIGYRPTSNSPRPALNTINDEFLTPSPQEFPRPYRTTSYS
jgi:hypothetical protein